MRSAVFFHESPRVGLILAAAFLTACGGDGGGPLDPIDQPPGTSETATATVDAAGGAVLLPDGAGVVFPAGVLTGSVPVTVTRRDPGIWLDASGATGRVVLTTTAPVSQFAGTVEIRVPLPGNATLADSGNVLAGVVDEQTGTVTVEPSTVRMIGGKPFMVVSTNHFSTRLFDWFIGKQPPSAAMLAVPYYNQGSGPFCWAASIHMVTQAASFQQYRLLTELIGKAGIDEAGISAWQFRTSSAIGAVVADRTGVRPERMMWDWVNANLVRDHIWREVGVNGRPVAIFSSRWEHAVVVVGYDMNTMYIHDPASTATSGVGYKARPWSEFVQGMTRDDKLITLVVPKSIGTSSLLTVNFLSQAVEFIKPSYGTADPPAIFRFVWDHTRADGYAFRHASTGDVGNPLPGEVNRLATRGEIQVANASRTATRDVSVYLDITAMGAPSGVGRLSTQRTITVAPNSVMKLQVPDIQVDTFRYNATTPVEYVLSVSALTGGSTVDQQSIVFWLDPVRPDLTKVAPNTAAVGDQVTISGLKLGQLPLNNTVLFNGTKVDSIVSWEDAQVKVIVPEKATTGPLVVKRGDVTSDSLEFTVSKQSTVEGTVAVSRPFWTQSTLNVTGPWTLRAVGPSLDYYVADTQHHILSVERDELAELSLSFSAGLAPSTWESADSVYHYELSYVEWFLESTLFPIVGSNPTLAEYGAGAARRWEFLPEKRGDTFRVAVTVHVFVNIYKDGVLIAANSKAEEHVAHFTVEAR